MTPEEYRKIVMAAIESEIEAYDFYSGVANKVQDSSLKSIFVGLASDERGHRDFLEGVLTSVKPISIDETKDYKVSATVEKPQLSVTMKPSDAIALAMKNEEEAMNTYAELARVCKDSEQRGLFESLARMERGHKVRLEETFTNMAFPEVW
ncbi:MAG TPA: ferritin [Deltaproteobacteria bacterium]|jgi:rubrerythrin|nr:ferritin [Deltaproteobacteria bacterium]